MKTQFAPLKSNSSLVCAMGILVTFTASASAQFTLPPFPASPAPVVIPGQTLFGDFGHSVSRIGDLNNDGVMDILVGAPFDVHPVSGLQVGGAYVRSGANGSIINLTGIGAQGGVHGTSVGMRFGWSVAGLADLDGDGYPEFAVGTPDINSVTVFKGKGGGVLYNLAIPTMGNKLPAHATHFPITPVIAGYSVADAGDVNGDGINDIIIGDPSTITYNVFSNPPAAVPAGGMAVIYDGATGANMMQVASGGDFTGLYGISIGGSLGWSVGAAGDWDGDGYDDVIVSSPNTSGGAGSVSIYSGLWISTVNVATPPPVPPVIVSYSGAAAGAIHLGLDVDFCGDMNGDAVGEVVVGAQGGGFVLTGGSTGSSPGILHVFLSADPTARQVVASGEDLNGDGVPDVVMGPNAPNGLPTTKGMAYSGATGLPMFLLKSGLRSGDVTSMVLLPDSTGNGKAEVVLGLPRAKVSAQTKGQVSLILR